MNTLAEQKDLINYIISSIGILVTAIFSYLVWRATVKSTEVSQRSYELTQAILKDQAKIDNATKEEFKETLLNVVGVVKKILINTKDNNGYVSMSRIPREHGLSENTVAKYFDKSERDCIKKSWDKLDDYMNQHFTEIDGNHKTTFRGNELDIAKQSLVEVILEFELLELILSRR